MKMRKGELTPRFLGSEDLKANFVLSLVASLQMEKGGEWKKKKKKEEESQG